MMCIVATDSIGLRNNKKETGITNYECLLCLLRISFLLEVTTSKSGNPAIFFIIIIALKIRGFPALPCSGVGFFWLVKINIVD